MKKLKTLISVMLCAMLVLSLVVPSMADSTYSVTVNNAIPGETYTLYKIFDFESQASDATKGVYTVKGSVYDLLEDKTSAQTGVTLGTTTNHENELYVTSVDDEVKFSKFLHDNVASIGTAVNTQIAPANGTIVFENVTENGYYFVDTTAGSLFILDSTTPNMVVNDKNKGVTVDKKVSDKSNGTFKESNNAQIGDTVYFKTTVTIPKGSTNVVVHDIMESGLTLTSNSVKASVGGTDLATTNYSVNYSPAKHDDTQCTFEVTFAQTYLDSLSADTTSVVLTYNAKLNKDATCGDNTNDNTTKVKFGENSWTAESTTKTKTLDVNLEKTDNKGVELTGAEFTLKIKGGAEVPVVLKSTGVYRVAVTGETGVKIEAGNVRIEGLDFDQNYALVEDKAPAGYNRVNGDIDIEKGASDFTDKVVINETGTELPDTGSTGTKILFTVGGIMMVVAFVLFTSKRRMAAED